MKSKKIIGLLLGITMISSLFTGCSKGASAEGGKDVTIKYATYSAGPDHIQDLEQMIGEFEKKNDGIKVEYEIIGYDNYFNKLQTQAASKTLPDIFEINYENFVNYAENGLLLDLDELSQGDSTFKSSDLSGESFEYFKYNDKLFGLTEKFSDVVFYYNKELFDASGVSYPTSDWTWNDELEASQKIMKSNAGVYGTYSPVQFTELYKTVAQNGGSLFDKDGNPTINSKENIEAVQWMIDKMNKYNIQPTPIQMSGKTPEEMFKNGEVAMIRTGTWMFETFENAPFAWDISLEPGNVNQVNHIFADGIVASANTKHEEAVWEFIKFMSVDPIATQIRIDTNWDLPAVSNEEVIKSYLEKPTPENREVVFEALNTGIMPPVVKKNVQTQDIINGELNQAVIGTKTVQQSLNDAQIAIEKLK